VEKKGGGAGKGSPNRKRSEFNTPNENTIEVDF